MPTDITESVRRAQKLQDTVDKKYQKLLACRTNKATEIYRDIARVISTEFDQDHAKVISYIQVKLHWPLSHRHLLLQHVQNIPNTNRDKLDNIADFMLDPTTNIRKIGRFRIFVPTIATIERQYGSGVSSIFHLQSAFFLINLLTLIVWLGSIIIPYNAIKSSTLTSNVAFSFSTIFTTKGYLSESILFQGSFPKGIINNKYDLPLIYFLTIYVYFLIWFIFIAIRFSITYKRKVFNSILNAKLGIGFTSTFARYNFAIKSSKEKDRHNEALRRQFLDLIENEERVDKFYLKKFETYSYKFKIVISNLFYILLSIVFGGINWIILASCNSPTINCYGSIIYLVLINRLMPYVITILTQFEEYKYLSYKFNVIAFRCIFLNICTLLSFTIHFFTNKPSCYETAYGQYVYLLLLGDTFASLIFPILFGFIFDIIFNKANRNYDGINIHVQTSPPLLLYSQFLIWLGIYFSPLLSIMILLNILFSFISHRLYIYIRSRHKDSYKRVFIWNGDSLEYLTYLLACIILIVSVTCVVVFTTVVKPSENCGPYRQLSVAYEVINIFLNRNDVSVLWLSIFNFITSPGFIYFLFATFIVVVYKLRHEEQAEKQLVFIRDSSLASKKKSRENAVKKLHQQPKTKKEKSRKYIPTTSTRNETNADIIQI